MTDRITATLAGLFETHRIVFWSDPTGEMREAFDGLVLEGVTPLRVANDEFGLKYRILRAEPEGRFLIYRDAPAPPDRDNWLLDIEMAAAPFRADHAALWRSELGLGAEFDDLVREHAEFFRAEKRLAALKRVAGKTDTETALRLHMLAICAGAEGGLDTVVEALLRDLAAGRDDGQRTIERTGLMPFLWERLDAAYGYRTAEPDIEDFAMSLFESAWRRAMGDDDAALNAEALLVFRRWKNDRRGMAAFETLSETYADRLGIEGDLAARDTAALVRVDHYRAVDRAIVLRMVEGLAGDTLAPQDALAWIRTRRQSHWYPRYEHVYQAIRYGTEFRQALGQARLKMDSPADGFRQYANGWFRLDQFYRKFVHHLRAAEDGGALDALAEAIENLYANRYVQVVNDAWQDRIAPLDRWEIEGVARQDAFYNDWPAMYRRKDQKVAVIVSDALRYEVADECLQAIRGQNRFDATLTPMLGMLPSYTQLGMAALLPHQALSFKPGGDLVLADGESTKGRAPREKVLARGREGDRVRALGAEDLLALKTDARKALFREHDVVYVYHNAIDDTGDGSNSEVQVADAAEQAVVDMVRLVKSLASANFSNILITADHGFLFRHRALDDSDFIGDTPKGEGIDKLGRRHVIGRGLSDMPGMKRFTAAQLGLTGEGEVLIPNSIKRLRAPGSGSRYVHGGASLQEIVLPVLSVSKQRAADIRQVDVQSIVPGRGLITSSQIAVTFFQEGPVSEKVQARTLLAGIYTGDGTLISDEHVLVFDFTSDNPRERELPVKFLLSRVADDHNNETVFLTLRQRIGRTTRYEDYTRQSLQLRRGMTTDFDF